jgi:hypothetical protein
LSFDYEVKIGSKLKGVELSLQDFENLLVELNDKCIVAECHLHDPYCGLMIDGLEIGWNDEVKEPSEWSAFPSEKDEQRKLKAGIEEAHEEERAALDFLPNDEYQNNRDAAKKLGEKLVEGFASSMDNIFRNALKEIKK